MIAFVLKRLVAGTLFVAVVSVGALTLGRLAPGDAGGALTGESQQLRARQLEAAGLDRPFLAQLRLWLAGLVRLDLGRSLVYNRPVRELVAERAGATAELASLALLTATLIGLPLGIWTGAQPRSVLTWLVTPISIALIACPPIVAALTLALIALSTGWMSMSPGSLALPVVALALPIAATLERIQSQATREVMVSPDLTAAAARGVTPARLIWIHAARQSLRPVLGLYGIIIGSLFSGSLAVEMIASWPGLGSLMLVGLMSRDLFLVGGCALVGAAFIAIGNLLADLLRAWIDPRVRHA